MIETKSSPKPTNFLKVQLKYRVPKVRAVLLAAGLTLLFLAGCTADTDPTLKFEGQQANPRLPIASQPVAINLVSGNTPTQHVFGRNASGHLIHYYWWASAGWRAENLTQRNNIGTAYRITSDFEVINLQSGNTPTQHVFARNPNGHLIHYYWWASAGWRAENLTQRANIGTAYRIVGDLEVINLQSGDTPTQHVFARNTNGHLIHYYWSPAASWRAENLTTKVP